MKKKKLLIENICSAVVFLFLISNSYAAVSKTTYPVVFAHGMGGFDTILGYNYWGNDYGVFVGDPCDSFLEVSCNPNINDSQKSFVAQVQPLHNSEFRGAQLADQIEGYMATTGVKYVNLVGHSQGGMDIRKAAKVLYQRKGYQVVKVAMSISSPHRGSPLGKYVLQMGTLGDILKFIFNLYGDIVYTKGNDTVEALMQFVYDDYSPDDGKITGAKVYNQNYPVSSQYAARYVSVMTAQKGLDLNPLLLIVKVLYDIDGNGYCIDDCDNDGVAGCGNGIKDDLDDDGLVGINSQQMGYRLKYTEVFLGQDYLTTDTNLGYVGNINYPNELQMTSTADLINQDHMDVIGLGPDTFDEMEFYAAIFDYIAYYD
ncbi:MAG: acetyltransferase [Spirochaetota bacterium]